jgi:DNA-binding response OmpR family regulator
MNVADSTVLIVEDDPAIQALIEHLIMTAGYHVETAADGSAGLARIEAGGIDLVLLDVALPGMDGMALCQQVRAHKDDVYLPIIMITGMADDETRRAGFAAGANDFVTKPFKLDDLLDRVRVWMGTRRYLQASQQQYEHTEDRTALGMALTTNRDLIRLLMLLVSVLESWKGSRPSVEDIAELSGQFRDAAAVLATRIDLLMHDVDSAPTNVPGSLGGAPPLSLET